MTTDEQSALSGGILPPQRLMPQVQSEPHASVRMQATASGRTVCYKAYKLTSAYMWPKSLPNKEVWLPLRRGSHSTHAHVLVGETVSVMAQV